MRFVRLALIVLVFSTIVPSAPPAQADNCDHYRRSQKLECLEQVQTPSTASPSVPSRTATPTPTTKTQQPIDQPIASPDAAAKARIQALADTRLIVKFKAGRNVLQASVHTTAGAAQVESTLFPDRVIVTSADTTRSLAAYQASSDVLWVERDQVGEKTDIPNDQYVVPFQLPSHLSVIHAPQAWDVTHGSETVKIGFVDSGAYGAYSTRPGWWDQYSNPDLRNVILTSRDFTGSPLGTDDIANHGSSTAAITAAETNNTYMGAGVAYRASLIIAKTLGDDGFGLSSWIQNGMLWDADQGAQIINASVGSSQDTPCSQSYQDTIDLLWSRGIPVIAAAGNNFAKGPISPASCNHVIAVGATDQNDVKANFSNYGQNVHIAAPGVRVATSNNEANLSLLTGTSASAPIVTGVGALILSLGLTHGPEELVDRILGTADRILGTGTYWKYGRVNAARAVSSDYLAGCSQRPKVLVKTYATVHPGELSVTLTAQNTYLATNRLRKIQFTPDNTVVLIAGNQPQDGPFTWPAPAGTQSMQFLLERKTAGPFKTSLVVVDGCGPWSTFAGAGTGFP